MATATSKELSGKSVDFGIQLAQRGDVAQPQRRDLLAGLLQHLGRQVDAGDALVLGVVGQGQAGADTDLQHFPSRQAIDQRHGAAAADGGNPAEYGIIDARPTPVGGTDRIGIERSTWRCARPTAAALFQGVAH